MVKKEGVGLACIDVLDSCQASRRKTLGDFQVCLEVFQCASVSVDTSSSLDPPGEK